MKKLIAALLVLCAVTGFVFAQGGSEATQPAATETKAAETSSGPIEVVWWHTWGGNFIPYIELLC